MKCNGNEAKGRLLCGYKGKVQSDFHDSTCTRRERGAIGN